MTAALPLIILAWIGKFICQVFTGGGKQKPERLRAKHLAIYVLVLLPLSTLVFGIALLTLVYCGIVYGIFPLIGLV